MKKPFFLIGALVLVLLAPVPGRAQPSLPQLNPLWGLNPGESGYLTSDNTQRGMAYNGATGHVLLVNRSGGLSVKVIDGLTGADLGTLNVTSISGGTLVLSQIRVDRDGVIYAANLVNDSSVTPFKLYRWANESAAPVMVYSGPLLSGTRWGDNMAIRGHRSSTQILLGQGGAGVGNHVDILRTSDGGATFTHSILTVTGLLPGETRGGLAFGRGNSFFCKDAGGTTLRYALFGLSGANASVVATATLPTGLSGFGPLTTDPDVAEGAWIGIPPMFSAWVTSYRGASLMAAIQVNTASTQTDPHKLYLFDVSNPGNPIVLGSWPLGDPKQNSLAAGAVDWGGGGVFGLDTNNGLWCYDVLSGPLGPSDHNFDPGSHIDIGLRVFDGTNAVPIACEAPGPFGELYSPLHIHKNGTNYGICLTDPVPGCWLSAANGYLKRNPSASTIYVQTPVGIKVLQKMVTTNDWYCP